ncbi:MAG: 2-C-methyl-D-erythritol 4-phosphate cytidylyltransferase [Clostridiales bacterium]|nr:2-C-methyl-D-erythritol 4-phosphate cytidylyltransferase [Clostridiales bacterium]
MIENFKFTSKAAYEKATYEFPCKIVAVVVAGGSSTRMGTGKNKLYLDLAGKPVLAVTLEVFQNSSLIDYIVIVSNKQDIEYCHNDIVSKYNLSKVHFVVHGGQSRQQSVYNGLLAVPAECGIILIHDGARPFVSQDIIKRCIETVKESGCACTAVPVKDTIKTADKEHFITDTFQRENLWSVQTPQAFWTADILAAHQKAIEEGYSGTDDAVLMERTGMKVKLVMGSYENIKITTIEDHAFAEFLAGRSTSF